MEVKQHILANLLGDKPVDWEQVNEYYKIGGYGAEKLKFVQRDDVMKSLVTVTEQLSIERAIWKQELPANASDEARELKNLSRNYIVLANKDARLPKFSKWVASMFADNAKIMGALAKAGQIGGKSEIVISCNPADILRGGVSKHFATCLGCKGDGGGWGGAYSHVLQGVLERCPGIAVAYIDHPEDATMKCRVWLNHARVNGKDCIAMLRPYGNGFSQQQIADLIASKGYDVIAAGDYNGNTKFELINGFDTNGRDHGIHWDITEYGELRGNIIAEAKCEPKLNLKKAA